MRKLTSIEPRNISSRFSPLAGIRYAETLLGEEVDNGERRFSPLAGIRYAETLDRLISMQVIRRCFSPLAGIRYAETSLSMT